MLKQRIWTAIALILPLIAALFYLPPSSFAALLSVFIAVGAWEWAALAGFNRVGVRIVYTIALVGIGAVVIVIMEPITITVVLSIGGLWWLWALRELLRPSEKGMYYARYGKVVAGFLVLVPAWVAVAFIHTNDAHRPFALLFLLILVTVADSAAYFAGRIFGRTKLAPSISPGKTVEGVVGGVLAVVFAAHFYGTMVQNLDTAALIKWIGIVVFAALFSVVGDLTESKMKRIAGVKDSGRVLPGHGGVLDRIDALTAAAPIYVLGWWVFLRP